MIKTRFGETNFVNYIGKILIIPQKATAQYLFW